MKANLHALAAVALWASLATLGVSLRHLPPFLLTGLALLIGSTLAWPSVIIERQRWRIAPRTLVLGVGTLFGYHFLLFIALRLAPAVEVNLVNYLWPLLIVVLSPWYLPGGRLRGVHVLAALLGFVGAAVAILGERDTIGATSRAAVWAEVLGYLLACGSALLWANYSLQTKRLELAGKSFPTAAVGLFGLVAGLLSLLCHWALEPAVRPTGPDWLLLTCLGLGPLGAAFFLWDRALKLGDVRQVGVLSYLTPLLSTVLLLLVTGRAPNGSIVAAATLIVGAALLGTRRR